MKRVLAVLLAVLALLACGMGASSASQVRPARVALGHQLAVRDLGLYSCGKWRTTGPCVLIVRHRGHYRMVSKALLRHPEWVVNRCAEDRRLTDCQKSRQNQRGSIAGSMTGHCA